MSTVEQGGIIAFLLLGLGVWLWYELGFQYFFLKDGNANPQDRLRTSRQFTRSIVTIAPLLGLLGTVVGMIETFDSLQSQSLYTQSGGIAAGISQALITTEMGLLVAIPGLFMSRAMDRKIELLQMTEVSL